MSIHPVCSNAILCIFCFRTNIDSKLESSDSNMERFKDDAVIAFAYIFQNIMSLLNTISFSKLKKICTLKVAEFPEKFTEQMQEVEKIDKFLEVLSNPLYCSWINTRLLRRIVLMAEIPEAVKWIDIYEEWLHPKKVSDVIHCFQAIHFKPEHTEIVKAKINANPEALTVSQVVRYCQILESNMCIPEGSARLIDCNTGCLTITFRIPLYCVLHAYEMAKKNLFMFRQFHIQYIDVKKFPKVFVMSIATVEKSLLSTTLTCM